MKPVKVSQQEARNLKYYGFIPMSISKLIVRKLIKKMVPFGVRVSMKRSNGSLFVGYSIPLNQKELNIEEIDKLEEIMDELKEIIKNNKF